MYRFTLKQWALLNSYKLSTDFTQQNEDEDKKTDECDDSSLKPVLLLIDQLCRDKGVTNGKYYYLSKVALERIINLKCSLVDVVVFMESLTNKPFISNYYFHEILNIFARKWMGPYSDFITIRNTFFEYHTRPWEWQCILAERADNLHFTQHDIVDILKQSNNTPKSYDIYIENELIFHYEFSKVLVMHYISWCRKPRFNIFTLAEAAIESFPKGLALDLLLWAISMDTTLVLKSVVKMLKEYCISKMFPPTFLGNLCFRVLVRNPTDNVEEQLPPLLMKKYFNSYKEVISQNNVPQSVSELKKLVDNCWKLM